MSFDDLTIAELATVVNQWCRDHQLQPLHQRVGTSVSVRNIRYYQTLGLVDRPSRTDGRGFQAKHRLQLIAIRVMQARGLPLGRIRLLLQGRTEEDLEQLERNEWKGLTEPAPSTAWLSREWRLVPVSENLLILSRLGQEITHAQRQQIFDLLEPHQAAGTSGVVDGFRPEID